MSVVLSTKLELQGAFVRLTSVIWTCKICHYKGTSCEAPGMNSRDNPLWPALGRVSLALGPCPFHMEDYLADLQMYLLCIQMCGNFR